MKNKLLRLDKVSYRYKDAKKDEFVFKDLSYEFEEGKIYAIRGKSGSGKTTLLSLLSGLERPTLGDVYFEEKNLRKVKLDYYRSNLIGIVFQSFNLLPHLTAAENIKLSMNISHIKCKNKNEKVLELLNSVGLDKSHGNRRVLKLSGGEQQRVAIARSLSYNPKLILADEPTGNLDKETEKEIMNIFKKLAHEEKKCVIIVTHSDNVSKEADVVFDLKKHN